MKLTVRAVKYIRANTEKCFLCKRILESLDANSELNDWPVGEPVEFPKMAQANHLRLELGSTGKALQDI